MLTATRRYAVFLQYTPTSYFCIEVISVAFIALLSSFNINTCFLNNFENVSVDSLQKLVMHCKLALPTEVQD